MICTIKRGQIPYDTCLRSASNSIIPSILDCQFHLGHSSPLNHYRKSFLSLRKGSFEYCSQERHIARAESTDWLLFSHYSVVAKKVVINQSGSNVG